VQILLHTLTFHRSIIRSFGDGVNMKLVINNIVL